MEGPGSDPEAVKARLREFILVFHGSAQASSVDARGRLELAAADTNEDWLEFVNSADVKALSELRTHAWSVTMAKEKEVASKLGLLHLFCEPALLSDPSYLAFLSRLDAAAPTFQALLTRSPKLRELVLRVCSSGDVQRFRVDPRMGFINVPVDADADRVRLVLEMRGPEAHGVAGRFRSAAEERGSASLQAKRRLRLRGLEGSSEVSEAQFVLCCRRLAFAQAPIPALLQGLNLRVSDRFDCDDDGTVSIRWDWS